MKKIYIGVATPSSGQTRINYAYSLARMVAYFSNNRLLPDLEEQRMEFFFLEGSGISDNREILTRRMLEIPELTHTLWIDDDMGFHYNTLHIMMARRQPIVACTYRRRVPPGEFTAATIDQRGYIGVTEGSTGLQEAYNVGFGFCLIERKVLEAVPAPRYLLKYSEEDQRYSTEDFCFFSQARAAGFSVLVDLDASKQIWHEGSLGYSWLGNYADILPKPKAEKEPEKPAAT